MESAKFSFVAEKNVIRAGLETDDLMLRMEEYAGQRGIGFTVQEIGKGVVNVEARWGDGRNYSYFFGGDYSQRLVEFVRQKRKDSLCRLYCWCVNPIEGFAMHSWRTQHA